VVLVYEVRQGYQCTTITPEFGQLESRRIVREREQDGRENTIVKAKSVANSWEP
jgi:hypothetical protein